MTISTNDWQAKGQHFQHRDYPIFYVDEGEGEVLLFIHGFPTSSWDWAPLWQVLTQRYRCIAPDMIGFGFSAKPQDYDYRIMDQADLHEALLQHLGVGQAHVLAHDYGDTVAQELLARHNQRQAAGEAGLELQSMCLLNGGLFPETHQARLVQRLLNSPLGVVLTRLMNKRSFERSFSAVFGPNTQPAQAELDAFWQLVSREGGVRIMHKLIRYIDDRRQHRERWVGALQNTSIPLRLINGPADPVSGLHMTERYRELVPNPDVELLDAAIGHYPQVEDPEGTLKAFLDFADNKL
ncbi:MAG: alpha/beta hydrolase [Salinisphaeraceae bacterium]|nr:alpha/beta hydrolase [Salinisphaeraceae bacterium]